MVVRPQSVGPGDSWAFCLSFALQIALVLRVPVGSLLTYDSHPSRWGHPCGVEASLPFGLFLHVIPALRDEVTIWVRCWLGAPADSRGCCSLFSLWLGFEPLSEAALHALSSRCVSWWSSLRPRVFGCPGLSPVFFPVPCYGYMFTSTTLAPGLGLSLAPYPRSYWMGLEPLSEAPLCALQLPAPSFLVVLAEAV